MRNKFPQLGAVFIFLIALSISAIGQSAADNKFKNFNVKFRRGESQAVKRGAADYDMSYVYNFKVRKGQLITVGVDSGEKELTFDVVVYREGTLGSKVKQWSGNALRSGIYSVVLAMNNENAKKVPYRLQIKVK